MTHPPDADLLRRHVDGDATAFEELVARHRDRLWAVALRTLGDREEAADALQDALIKAFAAAGSFRGDAAVTTWLHRIVVNACLDRARRSAVRPTVPLPDEEDRTDVLADAEHEDPAVQRERHIDVLDALQHLAADQRAAIVLVDMEGYPVDEAARILGCAPGTVKSRCSRARRHLGPLLAGWNPRTPEDVRPSESRPAQPKGGGSHGR